MNNYWLSLCVSIMQAGIRYVWGDTRSMRRFDALASHAISVIECAYSPSCRAATPDDALPLLCNSTGYGLRYGGKYAMSLDCYMKALSMQETILSRLSSLRATLYYNIAWLYDELMDYDSALKWYLKDLEITEAVHGRDGISTAPYDWHFKALEIHEEILGCEHNFDAEDYNNIGVTYCVLGQKERGFEYCLRAVRIIEKSLGNKHPDTIALYESIAAIYGSMENDVMAKTYLEKINVGV